MNDNAEFAPSFLAEADALARVLALAFDTAAERTINDPAEPDVVRLLIEALEHAYLAGRESR